MDYNKYWNYEKDDYSDRPDILFQKEHVKYVSDCKSVIDLGCGNGQLVKKLNNKKTECYGITYNPQEVENKLHKFVQLGDMHDIPFENNRFEAFVMWDSLEHCQSAFIALCEAKRVLVDGGKGLIFMPGQNWLDCHCHITCYTIAQMKQLFRQSNFRLVSVYEKKYPDNPTRYCKGMAVYEVQKDDSYNAVFAL
jgi:ubiquinone/menaquinone biosynthesis C-methylase UbiE